MPLQREKRKSDIWHNLPVEVMAEIFCKLPIKSIIRCTSVCKSWNSLIKNPNFIHTHLKKPKLQLILHRFPVASIGSIEQRYTLRFDDKKFTDYMPVLYPKTVGHYLHVAGSCNGVVSLHSRCLFVLWNPSIRKSFFVPQPNFVYFSSCCRSFIGLGFDDSTNDYKLLRFMSCPTFQFKAELYSLNSNSWRDITDIVPTEFYIADYVVPAFVNGALHWPVTHWNEKEARTFVMVFDLKDEVFHEIMLPECLVNLDSAYIFLKAFEESTIAVIDDKNSDIWVMKDYGAAGSWVKLPELGNVGPTLGNVGRQRSLVLGFRNNRRVMGFRNDGEVLLELYDGQIVSHDPHSLQTSNLMKVQGGGSFVYRYVESLALLDKGHNQRI
ncbi:hypothetical protein JCGZ_00670 [Jatropha curcas]|uniref:F-box domain-containing protein n=1 Tax=Jatropha curcas TaxID=180498 RepID=A0A067KVA0_JATCU|nr:F-box/kelch-repeat protein At3g06240 [Jatropha curcas]KDP38913.1 hypothetical protein JCGZ_00670 [Jatropha curcas]